VPEVSDSKEIADFIISQYLWDVFDEVHVVYTHVHGTIRLLPASIRLLPLEPARFDAGIKPTDSPKSIGFEYLPSAPSVIDTLAPLYIKGVLYGALVEAYASEQSSRMVAMEEASKNAEEMLGALRLAYNRARQTAITQEITEIVSGAAALVD
jgi:F-type H+-transporting ATPase subunit gamma